MEAYHGRRDGSLPRIGDVFMMIHDDDFKIGCYNFAPGDIANVVDYGVQYSKISDSLKKFGWNLDINTAFPTITSIIPIVYYININSARDVRKTTARRTLDK